MSLFNFHESYTATLRLGNLPWLAVYGMSAVVGAKLQKVMRKTKDFVLFLQRWVFEQRNWFSPYERYERRKRNFLYRKLFTPYLNVFPLYESYYTILHILHAA